MALLEHDPLTQAFRREALSPTLAHLLRDAVATGTPLALAVLDVDHFKALNDVHGHAVGDAVLRTVVARIMNALRDEDLVFRYGGTSSWCCCRPRRGRRRRRCCSGWRSA